ncbi:hypothetical protein CFP56_018793 [Quercus suber]|uniref:Uncharacterized protein n=1 Tax=Quercus suber TaxID=58331 RepID=A0AAW0KI37_QUESU
MSICNKLWKIIAQCTLIKLEYEWNTSNFLKHFWLSRLTDLAYQILCLHRKLALYVDEKGILPLQLLANVPFAFRSCCQLGFFNSIIYKSKYY